MVFKITVVIVVRFSVRVRVRTTVVVTLIGAFIVIVTVITGTTGAVASPAAVAASTAAAAASTAVAAASTAAAAAPAAAAVASVGTAFARIVSGVVAASSADSTGAGFMVCIATITGIIVFICPLVEGIVVAARIVVVARIMVGFSIIVRGPLIVVAVSGDGADRALCASCLSFVDFLLLVSLRPLLASLGSSRAVGLDLSDAGLPARRTSTVQREIRDSRALGFEVRLHHFF